MKRWFTIPFLILLLALSACGNQNNEEDTVTRLSGTVYQPSYLDAGMNADTRVDTLLDTRAAGDCVYFLGERSSVNADEPSGYRILRLPLDGGTLEALPYTPADALPEGAEGGAVPAEIFPGGDGSLWVREEASYGWYDLPENFDPETQDKWDYCTGTGQSQLLRKLDADGGELLRLDVTAWTEPQDEDGYTPETSFAVDGQGNLYLLSGHTLNVLDGTGAARLTLDWPEENGSLVLLADGTVAAFCHPLSRKNVLRPVDLDAGDWGTRYEPDGSVDAVWAGFGEWLGLYAAGDGLYGWNAEENALTLLAPWTDAAVNPELIQYGAGLPDGRILLVGLRDGAPDAMVLSAAETVPEKEILTYVVFDPDEVNWERVNEFNRTHADVQIEVKDYTTRSENGFSYTTEGRDRLLTEIAAGKVPDLMGLGSIGATCGGLPFRQMAKKGYLEDLLPYIDSDPEIRREDLMDAPLNAALIDGGLYMTFDSVSIHTMVGPARVVGDRYSWTLAELLEAFATMPEGASVVDYFYTKENILGSLVAAEDYIDWETGTCSFDCDSFRAALMLVNECPAEYEWPDTPGEHRSLDKRKLDGLQMLSIEPVCDFDGKLYLESERFPDGMGGMMYGFGERLSYIGYPTEDGSAGSYFALRGNTAVMSSTCKNKEAAWEFLRESFLPRCDQSLEELLSDKSERFGTIPYTFWNGGFPLNRADFEIMRQYQTTLYTDELLAGLESSGKEFQRPVPEENAQRVLDLYNQVTRTRFGNEAVNDIIMEQAGPYFAGDRSLDDVVDQIQRRVTLYVNENR